MRISDVIKPFHFAPPGSTSSALESLPVPLAYGRDYSIIVQLGTMATAAQAVKTYLHLQAATEATGTFTTLSSAITVLSTSTKMEKVSEARIWASGTLATGVAGSLIIDGVTLTKSSANNTLATAASFKSSGSTVCILNLETVIPQVCTNLLATRVSTVATACEMKVYPKYAGYTFDITATALGGAAAGLDGHGVTIGKKIFAYDFSAHDIIGSNSSYKVIKATLNNAGASAIIGSLTLLEAGGRYHGPIKKFDRSQFSTVSSGFAT